MSKAFWRLSAMSFAGLMAATVGCSGGGCGEEETPTANQEKPPVTCGANTVAVGGSCVATEPVKQLSAPKTTPIQ